MSARRRARAALSWLALASGTVGVAGADRARAAEAEVAASGAAGGPVLVDLRLVPEAAASLASTPRPRPLFGRERLAELRARSLGLPPQPGIGAPGDLGARSAVEGAGFFAIDADDPPHAAPPDPQLAVGPNHLVVVVDGAAAVYDKTGAELVAPISLEDFFASVPGCAGSFDPTALYDEEANRFFVGTDTCANSAAGCVDNRYCMAVSRTADPSGDWYLYWLDTTADAGDFFDFPRAGIGDQAIFLGGNVFGALFHADVWALDKAAMYAGHVLGTPVRRTLSYDTPIPMNAHGFAQGTWPDGAHYFVTEGAPDGTTIRVWRWSDPFGADTMTSLGTVDLDDASGVTGALPVNAPQKGSAGALEVGDFRPLDLEYRNGRLFLAQMIACNPGGGTVDCVRWAELDPAAGGGAAVVQSGVTGSSGEFRIYPDLAVDDCGGVAVGYTKTGPDLFPSVYLASRAADDPAGTLPTETLLRAATVPYSAGAADPPPYRWGDYTGATSDPDGRRLWYVGELAKSVSNAAKWGTWVASIDTGCGAPSAVRLDPFTPPDLLRFCGPVELTGAGITPGSVLKAYLSTASGPVDLFASGVAADTTTDSTWSGELPCPFPAPNAYTLGQGFLALQLVRTDLGFDASNLVGVPLIGEPAQGLPSVLAIDGALISDTSWEVSIGLANVEQVLANDGTTVHRIDGTGFASPLVNLFTATGNCGPLTPDAASATTIDVRIPPSCPVGPGSLQVVNRPSFRASNAVSAPLGAAVTISDVSVAGDVVSVDGSGFSPLTVINLFAAGAGGLTNFGGFDGQGAAKVALSGLTSTHFSFALPHGALAGKAYVEAINPPFIPFASSAGDPDGAFTIP